MRIKSLVIIAVLATAILCSAGFVNAEEHVTATCSEMPISPPLHPGGSVLWTAHPSGGDGVNYTYAWSGDGLVAPTNGTTVTATYSAAGPKTASVQVTSNTDPSNSIIASCHVTVAPWPAVTGTCSASGDLSQPGKLITWTAKPGGGDGNYAYTWSGDYLSTITTSGATTATYPAAGRKTATVTITSAGNSKPVKCYATVAQYPVITGTCSGAHTGGGTGPIYPKDSVTWTVNNLSGGDGHYTYNWSTGLVPSADMTTATATYSAAGRKTAIVKVTSGGNLKTISCHVDVVENIASEILCVAAKVDAREKTLDDAMTAYTGSINSAYSARATALTIAYAKTTLADVRNERNAAWATFNLKKKAARTAWQTARNAAWATYRTAVIGTKATPGCGAPSGTGDGLYSSSEAVGQ